MRGNAEDLRELARLLRQRGEMGQGPIFLESMQGTEALALASEGRARTSQRPALAAKVGRAAGGTPAPSDPGGVRESPAPQKRAALPSAEAGAPPAALPVLSPDLEALRATVAGCTVCRLHAGRTQTVFADGNPNARLMVVGEAPGANEDASGLPFVGAAGKLLDLMLASVGLSRRDSVYICNVIKCRPPGNRNPAPDEIAACSPFLRRQIELVKPEAVLAVGSFSAQLLTGTEKAIGKLRGEVYSYEGVPLVITYHPAALLRNPGWSRAAWDDLQLLRQVMDGR
jgi:uracil-DNA glycosylase family 4